MKIGIISDTHGLLRPEILETLKGCRYILHAGDINRQEILDRLEDISQVYAVRGNNDKEWAEHLPLFLDIELAGRKVYMTHKKKDLPADCSIYDLVVYGHSHKYSEIWKGQTLFLNPGSCGPRKPDQAVTMTVLDISDRNMKVTAIDIPHST